jgi:hypothetical protein
MLPSPDAFLKPGGNEGVTVAENTGAGVVENHVFAPKPDSDAAGLFAEKVGSPPPNQPG